MLFRSRGCISPDSRDTFQSHTPLSLVNETAVFLVCRSVGYNWALREPIEGDCTLRHLPTHELECESVLCVVSIAAFGLVMERSLWLMLTVLIALHSNSHGYHALYTQLIVQRGLSWMVTDANRNNTMWEQWEPNGI